MSGKDKIEALLAMTITFAYIFLVATGKASVEGFVAIAVLVIKKYLDGLNSKGG